MPDVKVLILGGTTEARALAAAGVNLPGIATISSLAGRTSDPRLPPGPVRIGGFGGVSGLADYLRDAGIGAVVDATHPFASRMTGNAIAAAASASVPVLVLRRPGWIAGPGDRWHRVPSLAAAAAALPALGSRVFLTTGRQSIHPFAALDECWFLARSVEPPAEPLPRQLEVVLDRGPFSVAGERELLTRHRIDVLVTKDSGGVAPKLDAARELGVPVIMVDRPVTASPPTRPADLVAPSSLVVAPDSVAPPALVVATVAEAMNWLTALGPAAGTTGAPTQTPGPPGSGAG